MQILLAAVSLTAIALIGQQVSCHRSPYEVSDSLDDFSWATNWTLNSSYFVSTDQRRIFNFTAPGSPSAS
jgi:hypothetical protein